jgi:hypothetical protein
VDSVISDDPTMGETRRSKFGRLAAVGCATCGVLGFYAATVGLVPALSRHAEDGRIPWLKSAPVVLKVLHAYEWPAFCLARVPGARTLFELSADFWCEVTDAPETT